LLGVAGIVLAVLAAFGVVHVHGSTAGDGP
jgi:hypothetical protein